MFGTNRVCSDEIAFGLSESYAEVFVDPFDAEHRQIEGKMGTSGIKFVSIYHGSMVNPDMKVNFNMDTFMETFENPEKFNPRLIKKEKRNINGKNVTYADIRADFYNEPFRAECIGIYSGNEFWTILYFYNENDKKSRKVVEESIKSITIR